MESKAPESFCQAKILRIRVRSEDSAYVYAIFEASGGICAYSTLEFEKGQAHRDLELVIPFGQERAVDQAIESLKEDLEGNLICL